MDTIQNHLTAKTHQTPSGVIHYWVNIIDAEGVTLVFLPGLTVDHILFEKQIDYFKNKFNVFVWDAPAHGASWPFNYDFTLFDKAKWLNEIFEEETITRPVIIGQSMGGYLGQVYAELYPETLKGFISIDSAPLQRKYLGGFYLWILKRTEPIYRSFPWKILVKMCARGAAESEYGRKYMRGTLSSLDGGKRRYAKLAGYGYKILAEAYEKELPYDIQCPALLICGEKDKVGFCARFNKEWHKNSGIPLEWVKDAGHNSNTDQPEVVNRLIEEFVRNRVV